MAACSHRSSWCIPHVPRTIGTIECGREHTGCANCILWTDVTPNWIQLYYCVIFLKSNTKIKYVSAVHSCRCRFFPRRRWKNLYVTLNDVVVNTFISTKCVCQPYHFVKTVTVSLLWLKRRSEVWNPSLFFTLLIQSKVSKPRLGEG